MNRRLSPSGELNLLIIPLVLMVVLFVGAAGFGYWAYSERADYKDNSDKKVAAAVVEAKRETSIEKDKIFADLEKLPLEPFDGPSAFGSIHVEYPKKWSVYVHSSASQSQPLDAYFSPREVPSVVDPKSVFGLRVKVVQQQYAQVLTVYNGYVKAKQVTTQPYSLPKVPGVVGIRVDGLINPQKKYTGSMVIFPLRDKTIQIWTENAQLLNDFNNTVLPNLTFVP